MNTAEIKLDGWFFYKFPPKHYKSKKFDPAQITEWKSIKVPHDWDADGPFLESAKSGGAGGYAQGGVGLYKTTLTIPQDAQNIFLKFDGIYMRAQFWLESQLIGDHLYGYGPVNLNITKFVRPGQTIDLYVLVNNSKLPNTRWYTGSGIYREAWLISTPDLYFSNDGFFVQTPSITTEIAEVSIDAEIMNSASNPQKLTAISQIYDSSNQKVAEVESTHTIRGNSQETIHQTTAISTPHLWNVEDPYLYMVKTSIIGKDGLPINENAAKFGVRSFSFDGKGFTLNGKTFKLKGVCIHHDGGCVGSAVPPKVWERRLKALRSMGCNSIRTSHNPPASNFLDVTDRLGFLVIPEAFDSWNIGKTRKDWVKGWMFKKHGKRELANFIRRDRNHPSIILWSLGNEIRGMNSKKMLGVHSDLYAVVRELDPSRPITTCLAPNTAKRVLKMKKGLNYGDLVDVIATNYVECYSPEYHQRWPNKAILSTEAYHYWRRKHPKETHLIAKTGHHDYTEQNAWFPAVEHEYTAGQYLWVGIEYWGETRDPYPYHGRTNAPIRITGFKKPQAGFHSSVWRDDPYVHLAIFDEEADIPRGKIHFDYPKIVCHWNFEDHPTVTERDSVLQAVTYTNCESVELQLNGKTIGEKYRSDYPFNDMKWDIPYTGGELVAIGKNNGKEANRYVLKTAGKPHKVQLTGDSTSLSADGEDCVNVEARIIDEQGVLVPLGTHHLTFEVSGAAQIIGIDSGDLACHDSYRGNKCKTYWGEALLIVQTTKNPGKIDISVSSPGLQGESISLQSK